MKHTLKHDSHRDANDSDAIINDPARKKCRSCLFEGGVIFFGGGVIFVLAESKILMAESFFFWRRRISQADSYRDYNDSSATYNVSDRKKTTQPENNGGVIFFWDGNKKFTGGVVRDNLVPPVFGMSPTEEMMTQPKENVRVKKSKAGSLKIAPESFFEVAES
jgi:hypothetical protein